MPTLSTRWATAVSSIGPVSVGTLRWTMGDKPFLTAIVKARFAFRLNASMVLTGRPLIADRDRHLDDDPTKSVREPGDVVPHRERCDVWLRGHARPLGGKPVGVSMVRLAVFRAGIPMIDKTIHVLGERMSLGGAPRPYATMPLVWERAYGGVGFDANPVGVGADERLALPNLVDPMDAERAIGFGPISRYWKTRRGRVTTAERKQVEASQPRIAEGFDWAYYQAAPRDQQLTYLHGDEWLVLDGVDADRLRIQTRLPKVKAQARLLPRRSSPSDMGEIIPLVADSWGIDADEQVCTVTWRGAIPLAPQRDAAVLVAGAVTIDDAPVDWAQAYERVQLPPPDRLQPPRRAFGGGVTQISEAPPGAGAELVEDPLAATTIDPPRALANPSRPIESWPSLDGGEEEPVENTTDVTMDDLAITAPQTAPPAESAAELTAPQPMPLAIDTEPGGPPVVDMDDMPWVREVPIEPDPIIRRPTPPPSQSRKTSLPPAPLDQQAYADALRRAGASEHEVNVLMEALRKERES